MDADYLNEVNFNADGLIPAIAQDDRSGRILMVAWMNAEALKETVRTSRAVYYSRSRGKLWHKGEQSGHYQTISEICLDCDGDVVLLMVTQREGIACHTGRNSCFYRVLRDGNWGIVDPVIRDPAEIYGRE